MGKIKLNKRRTRNAYSKRELTVSMLFISNDVKKHKRKGVDSLFVTRGKRGRT